jgi:hypothetical protein
MIRYQKSIKIKATKFQLDVLKHTNGGKTFSAARRGTENPPWVLVSLAVNVLQK